MPSLVVSYAHSDDDIDLTVAAIDAALAVYRRALDDGVERYLVGRPSQTVYRRYNCPEELPAERSVRQSRWWRIGRAEIMALIKRSPQDSPAPSRACRRMPRSV